MATKREEYIAKLKTQLDQWNAEMAKWESQAAEAQASMRAEYEKQLAAIHRHQDQAREQLRKVQAASGDAWMERSEEHTSELQSRFDLVCRLLLEKKKT